MWKLGIIVAAMLGGAALTACEPKHANQCSGGHPVGCVNGEVCSLDRQRGCNVCECRPWDQTNTHNDPDDNNPPVPVH